LEVFGAFGNNRVDHVVDRDDPKKAPLLVENWDGEQVQICLTRLFSGMPSSSSGSNRSSRALWIVFGSGLSGDFIRVA
jgi:hypothetical protein